MPHLTYRPGGARYVAYGVAVIGVVMTSVMAIRLPSYVIFYPSQKITLAAFGLLVLAVLHGVGRSYVRLGDSHLEVRNGYRTHQIAYREAAGVSFTAGAPWPTLVTRDDERVMLFAIQRSDGSSSAQAVARIRERIKGSV